MRKVLRASTILAACSFSYLCYIYLTLPDVRALATVNPSSTAFMRLRERQAQAQGKPATKNQGWVPYARISANLKKAVTLTDAGPSDGLDADELIALDDALGRLEARQRQIVECRFFGGMTDEEIAKALGLSDRTVRREWVKARARLNHALYGTA